MNNDVDFNINNYTFQELVNLFDLKIPISKQDIDSKLNEIIDKYSANRNSLSNQYVEFFEKAHDKLLKENLNDCISKNIIVSDEKILDNEINFKTEPPPLLPSTYSKPTFKTSEFNKLVNDTVDDLGQNIDTTTIKKNGPRNIITHPNLDAVPTYNQEVVADALNPVKRRIIKKSLLIDTKFRPNYDSSINKKKLNTDLFIQLPSTIYNVISMKLSSLEFPISSYVISDTLKSNEMTIIYDNIRHNIVIPEGGYTAEDVSDYLNNNVFTITAGLNNIEAIYDPMLGKFIFKVINSALLTDPSGFGLDFNIASIPCESGRKLMHNLGWILGYRKQSYSGKNDYISEGQVDLGGTRYIYVLVNDYNNNVNENFISAYASASVKTNVLARIPQPAGTQEIIFNDSSDLLLKTRLYFGPVNLERLHIQILDEYDRVIDTNNMDYSMVLELECVFNL